MPHPQTTPPQPIQAIVFDCFGVIYEDAFKEFLDHHIPHSQPDAAQRHQYYYDLALSSDRGLIPDTKFYAELSTLSGEDPGAIQHRLRDVSVLNRKVVTILSALRPKYKVGMLSNAERSFLDRFLASHNLQDHFDVVLASSETDYVKPQQQIFEELGRRMALDLSQIAFIDDLEANTSAAARYGMTAIHYRNPHQLQQDLIALQ